MNIENRSNLPSPPSNPLDELTQINIDDLLKAFGLAHVKRGRKLLALLCRQPARRFAQVVLQYDQLVGRHGLAVAAQWLLDRFHNRLLVTGQTYIPPQGPALILANHPGLTDTVALFAALPRLDLRIIAADRPFLRALPNTMRHLILLDEQRTIHLNLIRQATQHLRNGGALLTFPAGKIEPDPAVLPGALASLQSWSPSIQLFTRLAPETQIIPTLVSGVLSPQAQRSPLRYLRRHPKDQEWLASTLQILLPAYQKVQVQVQFAPPIITRQAEAEHLTYLEQIALAMQMLIEQEPFRQQRASDYNTF